MGKCFWTAAGVALIFGMLLPAQLDELCAAPQCAKTATLSPCEVDPSAAGIGTTAVSSASDLSPCAGGIEISAVPSAGGIAADGALVGARPFVQTLSSQSEWFIVDAIQTYGASLEVRPFYEYDYLTDVGSYWRRLGIVVRESACLVGWRETLVSEYFAMQIFMGAIFSAAWMSLAAVSWPINRAIGGLETDLISVSFLPPPSAVPRLVPLDFLSTCVDGVVLPPHESGGLEGAAVEVRLYRYKRLFGALRSICARCPGTSVMSMAGNDRVAVKFRARAEPIRLPDGACAIDTYLINDAKERLTIAIVPTRSLCSLFSSQTTIVHIFDF